MVSGRNLTHSLYDRLNLFAIGGAVSEVKRRFVPPNYGDVVNQHCKGDKFNCIFVRS